MMIVPQQYIKACHFWVDPGAWVLLLCLLGFASATHSADHDWNALGQGRVIVDYVEDEQGIPGVRASFLVKADRDDIWATLVEYENFPQYFNGIDNIKVLGSDESGALVEFWVDAVLKKLHYVLYRAYDEPGHRLSWTRTSGDMKDIHGNWQILDTTDPEYKLLIYESFVDIGYSIVTRMIRFGAMKKAREMAFRLRDWIEQMEQR